MSANSASFTARAARPRSHRLLQLLEDARILERRHVLRDLLALRDRAQQPPHDLAGARLRQVVAEADVPGLRDRGDFFFPPPPCARARAPLSAAPSASRAAA